MINLQTRTHPERVKRVEGSTSSPESKTIRQFFDAIAVRYDFLNHVLSFRFDEVWRRKSRDIVLDPSYESLLDLGTGTGKFLELFLEAKAWKRCVGLDFSSQMLEEARRQLPAGVRYVNADFLALPFGAQSFDLIVSAFTLRSVKNMPLFLQQVYSLLTRGGRAGFLCLTRPTNFFFKLLYYPYLKIYLPLMGGLVSGNKRAYQFLSDSILTFQDPEQTADMMRETGFQDVQIVRFTFGSATLITGKK
jgi:demethylmenaquinone methyltransferase/2-methoxy-6-polyprenyl-1,4-benzoquinol methylase